MERRLDIDGLRALAIIPVLLFHFGVSSLPGGFTGVDLFFVISGFVVTKSMLNDINAKNFKLSRFYFKRFRRIVPALLVMLIFASIAALIILLPSDLIDFGNSLIATLLFSSNFYFWKSSGYFEVDGASKILLHCWSLAVEEQYYLFAPIAIWLICRFRAIPWMWFIIPPLLLSFTLSIATVFVGPTGGFYLLPARAWELLFGMSAALWNPPAPQRRSLREGMSLAGIGIYTFGLFTLNATVPFPGWNALYPAVGATLYIIAGNSADSRPVINNMLATRWPVFIGTISYSLYLVHWPVAAVFTYMALRMPGGLDVVWMTAVSLVLAWLLWRYVEIPTHRISWPSRWRFYAVLIIVMATLLTLGIIISRNGGFPQRFPGLQAHATSSHDSWGSEHCFNENPSKPLDWHANECKIARGKDGRILLWGDSFAAHYAPGIIQEAARIDADILQYTFAGCPPILAYNSLARVGCQISNAAVPGIIRRENIDTVIMAARWTETPQGTISQLGQTIKTLQAQGAKVIVIGQSPAFLADVHRIDYLSGQRSNALGKWQMEIGDINNRVARQAAGVRFINPIRYLCSGTACTYRSGTKYLYADYGHFSDTGSALAVRTYFPKSATYDSKISD